MKRIVLDTNVTISAFFWRGYPRTVYDLIRKGEITLLSSLRIEEEFIRVLAYTRFGLSSTEMLPIINELRRYVHFVETKSNVDIIKKDSTDNVFIECALDGKADYIISGDIHLLNIGSYKGVQIVRAKDFLIKEGFIIK